MPVGLGIIDHCAVFQVFNLLYSSGYRQYCHPCPLFFKYLCSRKWLAGGLEALYSVVNLCQSVLKLFIGAAVSLYGVVFQLFGLDIDARGFLHSALPTDHYVKGAESVTFSLLGLLNSEADLGLCCFHCVCAFLGCFRLQRYTLFLN